jgi:hypothetical protein
MNAAGFGINGAIETGSLLSGRAVIAARLARGGGNNRVFCLETADRRRLALKYYPPQSCDRRDRLGQEYEALSFLARHALRRTPRPIAKDAGQHCALYEWLDGEPATLHPRDDDVEQLAQFLIALQRLRRAGDAQGLRQASAAVFSPCQAVAQCEQRLVRLRASASDAPELRQFLDRDLGPALASARDRVARRYADLGLDPAAELAAGQRALSPSDFGLHNAVRGADGQLWFLDFEYFGWDDPAKLVCDAALHPGSGLSESDARRIVAQLSPQFDSEDTSFAVRRDVLYPVFGMIWCLIILNDYLPERRARRVVAGQDDELLAVLARQLDKARLLYQAICRRDPDFAPR